MANLVRQAMVLSDERFMGVLKFHAVKGLTESVRLLGQPGQLTRGRREFFRNNSLRAVWLFRYTGRYETFRQR